MEKKAKAFISFTIIIGLIIIGISISKVLNQENLYDIIYWMILAGLCQSFLVVFSKDRYVSVVFAIICAVQISYGVYYSVIIAAGSQVFFIFKEKPKTYRHIFSVPPYKTLFNVANFSISAYMSGLFLDFLAAHYHLNMKMFPYTLLMLLYTISYALLNTGILMLLMSFLNKESFLKLWKNLISWILPNFVAIAPFGYFIALLYAQNLGQIYLALLIGPLLLARYSFQLYQNSKIQYYKTIKALTAAIEAKDPYTEGHSRRVEIYAGKIAKKLNLSESKIQSIEVAALLHDIGKIGVDDSILNKKDNLSEDELSQIRNHPIIGVKILEDIELPGKSIDIIRYHHEKYDGTGYPKGLKKDEIPIEAYILSAADAYDAMTSNRPYRHAMNAEKAIKILIENRGTQFHPQVIDAFIEVLEQNQIKKRKIS